MDNSSFDAHVPTKPTELLTLSTFQPKYVSFKIIHNQYLELEHPQTFKHSKRMIHYALPLLQTGFPKNTPKNATREQLALAIDIGRPRLIGLETFNLRHETSYGIINLSRSIFGHPDHEKPEYILGSDSSWTDDGFSLEKSNGIDSEQELGQTRPCGEMADSQNRWEITNQFTPRPTSSIISVSKAQVVDVCRKFLEDLLGNGFFYIGSFPRNFKVSWVVKRKRIARVKPSFEQPYWTIWKRSFLASLASLLSSSVLASIARRLYPFEKISGTLAAQVFLAFRLFNTADDNEGRRR
ncbi:hypothetical protein C8J56DRAFT_888410 [Mycena floridula]|nr:hypothetical protein C8J56DRAFT_888410 [Mycena floridula]